MVSYDTDNDQFEIISAARRLPRYHRGFLSRCRFVTDGGFYFLCLILLAGCSANYEKADSTRFTVSKQTASVDFSPEIWLVTDNIRGREILVIRSGNGLTSQMLQ